MPPTSTKDFPDPVQGSPEGSKTGGKPGSETRTAGTEASGATPRKDAHLPRDLQIRERASTKSSLEAMLKGAGQEPQGAAATPGAEMTTEDYKKYVEPCAWPGGVDAEGKPDGSLSAKQVERAATETLVAMRPQPVGPVVATILDKLNERDEAGNPKNKYKSAEEVIEAAVAAHKELKDEEKKQADANKEKAA